MPVAQFVFSKNVSENEKSNMDGHLKFKSIKMMPKKQFGRTMVAV